MRLNVWAYLSIDQWIGGVLYKSIHPTASDAHPHHEMIKITQLGGLDE